MTSPPIPSDEPRRLQVLQGFDILDSLPEEEYDAITLLASQICQVPISLITLVDAERQWFKSRYGLEDTETPREHAFCAHAIVTPQNVFTVPDSRLDARFAANPYVTGDPHVVFYAGVPLTTEDGTALGTICVIDHRPRELEAHQVAALRALSQQVMKLLELRKANRDLDLTARALAEKNSELSRFAYVVSHDIKSPLNNILSISEVLRKEHAAGIDADGKEMLSYLDGASRQLKDLVDGILAYYAGASYGDLPRTEVPVAAMVQQVAALLDPAKEHDIRCSADGVTVRTVESALRQLLLNLIGNGIKYNRSDRVRIDVTAERTADGVRLSVKDNGIGIPPEQQSAVFQPFVTLGERDRFDRTGTGIGLATVQRIVERLGGTIRLESIPGTGSEFIITFIDHP